MIELDDNVASASFSINQALEDMRTPARLKQAVRVLGEESDTPFLHCYQYQARRILLRMDFQFARPASHRLHRFNAVHHQIDDHLCSCIRSARTAGGAGASSSRSDTPLLTSSRRTRAIISFMIY